MPIIPAEVIDRINALSRRLRTARKRRGLTVAQAAAKAGINRNTLTDLESGKTVVSIGVYISVLWAYGLARTLDAVADPDEDQHGKALEASRRSTRVRKRVSTKNDYDF